MQAESTSQSAQGSAFRGPWGVLRRSVLAGPALLFTALAVITALAAGAWSTRVQQQSAIEARQAAIDAAGRTLAQTAVSLLFKDDVSGLQITVQEAAHELQLKSCRVVLGDGTVIAASDVTDITTRTLPAQWNAKPASGSEVITGDESTAAGAFRFTVQGRGEGRVELAGPVNLPAQAGAQAMISGAALGALILGAAAAALFLLKRRLRGIQAVRGALLAIGENQTAFAEAKVSDAFGPEAAAWNRVVIQNETLHKQTVAERTEDALRERRRGGNSGLDSACDAMWQGLMLIDRDLRAKYANGAAAVLLQTNRDDLIGKDVTQMFTDEKVLESIRAAIEGTSFQRRTYEIDRKQGDESGMLRVSIRPVRRGDPAAAIVILEDITQLRVAEDARHAFVANASHELRTPLTNIRLYLENATDEGEKDPAVRAQALNVISQETRRLERIVNDMLSVAEIEAGSFKLNRDDVPLETVFQDVESDFKAPAKEKQMTLRFNLPPKLPKLHGDRDKIMMALHNLVGNALKYTPAGGKVEIDVEANDKEVVVAVKDNGIGIAEGEIENIFEKFYRAKDKRVENVTGSGLGLALARQVVRLHGGDITVESQMNKGSTFIMRLPVVQAKAA